MAGTNTGGGDDDDDDDDDTLSVIGVFDVSAAMDHLSHKIIKQA